MGLKIQPFYNHQYNTENIIGKSEYNIKVDNIHN